jgi:hypothetical protein
MMKYVEETLPYTGTPFQKGRIVTEGLTPLNGRCANLTGLTPG